MRAETRKILPFGYWEALAGDDCQNVIHVLLFLTGESIVARCTGCYLLTPGRVGRATGQCYDWGGKDYMYRHENRMMLVRSK